MLTGFNDEQITLNGTHFYTSLQIYPPQVVRGAYEFEDDEQRHFFGTDYRGIALVGSVERELKRKNPKIKHFIWGV